MATKTLEPSQSEVKTNRAALVQVDRALESSRDSGFNLTAASGEPVDNSIEAGATIIRLWTDRRKTDKHEEIQRIVFADNGIGIQPDILPHVLSLGFSTRYNQRDGLGRFGVGLKLAALSQGRRVDIYTKPAGSSGVYHSFIDLDLIKSGEQEFIDLNTVKDFPSDLKELMVDPRSNEPFESGTLVIWSKIDRLASGGKYGSSLNERLQDLTKFLARGYRRFIDKGLFIELNDRLIDLHDPTFQLENKRVISKFGKDLRATEIDSTDIEIDGHKVHVAVTLLPDEFRKHRGKGGTDVQEKNSKDLYIPDNDGRISILRQGREIYYDIVPRLYPGGVDKGGIDRFIGVEVSFPAALDEYFQVRNVKRGAEPVDHLREELRAFLRKPIKYARDRIREVWDTNELEKRTSSNGHATPEEVVTRVDQSAPRGRAGSKLTKEAAAKKVRETLKAAGQDESTPAGKMLKDQIEQSAITIVDSRWPGKELFTVAHLNNKSIVTLNHDHPFVRDVCDAAKDLAQKDATDTFGTDGIDKLRRISDGLDLLIMAYAKAENMHANPEEAYEDLRSYWGMFSDAYMRELVRSS